MMTLKELEATLARLRSEGARDDSPIILEGEDDELGRFVQASLGSARVETRCEDEGEAPGIVLDLVDVEVDE